MSVQSNSRSALLQETHSNEAAPGSRLSSAHTMSTSESLFSKTGRESQLVLPEIPGKDEEKAKKNPSAVPPDFDIFSIREKERQEAQEERERMKTMKIHEKPTYSTKVKAKQKELRQALQQEEKEEARKQATNEERLKAHQKSLLQETACKRDYPANKQTFRDYINDIREISLLEFGITVQREEIQRLEEIARNEERKVEKAAYCLKKEAARFEEFLKENQKNFVQALKIDEKEVEEETKKIEEEIQEVNSEIEKLQRGVSELTVNLKEYRMYGKFLRQLSEWQGKHSKRNTSTRDVKTAPSARERDASPPITAEQGQGGAAGTDAASPSSTNMDVPSFLLSSKPLTVESLRDIIELLKPLSPRQTTLLEDAETKMSSDEDEVRSFIMCFPLQEPELYFTDPQQLLSLFMEMEDEKFSILQKSQEAEESLNKVLQTFITTHESMETEIAELKEQVATLKSSIAEEEERAADLKLKVQLFSSGEGKADDKDKILASLSEKVKEVYCQCTGDSEGNLQTVQMLMVLEERLNDLLDSVEGIPPEKLEHALKLKEKERKIKLREEKLRQQEKQKEERLKKALERSKATGEMKTSRRLMFRSVLPPKKPKRKPKQEEIDKEKEEQLYYFT
ncbi:cilia- and flagella-associated protein 100 [Pezoporus occidentalis]|uniref:cilia- and flagella-associated protein 100 n=1 Tax=Pezoporus occidentalis TaxID=407982 RepID=UPI002F91A4F1